MSLDASNIHNYDNLSYNDTIKNLIDSEKTKNMVENKIHSVLEHVGNYIEETNRTFRIMSTLKTNTLLLPNMLTEISITDLKVENGLVVPSASISKDQNNNDYLYIAKKTAKGYKAQKINIEVVSKFDGEALIISKEISAGDNVIVEGARGIMENDIVRTK